MRQSPVQTVVEYLQQLKIQVVLFKYGDFADIMVRDQLMFGIANENIRIMLLTEEELTLKKTCCDSD